MDTSTPDQVISSLADQQTTLLVTKAVLLEQLETTNRRLGEVRAALQIANAILPAPGPKGSD